MKSLIIGGDGVLGSALVRLLGDSCHPTTRRARGENYFDLGVSAPPNLSRIGVVYLCAGTKGFKECEGNHVAFRTDVDGNIRLANAMLDLGVFIVFVSTDAVEWGGHRHAYTSNRLLVEQFLWGRDAAIVRPTKFDAGNVEPLAEFVVGIGREKKPGTYYWGAR